MINSAFTATIYTSTRPGIDVTDKVTRCDVTYNEHGYEGCALSVRASLFDTGQQYERALDGWRVRIQANDGPIFDGRIEDTKPNLEGYELIAFGDWREGFDPKVVKLYSTKRYADWVPILQEDDPGATTANFLPEAHEQDNNNRLYMGARDGENIIGLHVGWQFDVPDKSTRTIKRLTFDYDMTIPIYRRLRVYGLDADYANQSAPLFDLAGTGANQTGSVSVTGMDYDKIWVVLTSTGLEPSDPYTVSAQQMNCRVTNVRVRTIDALTVSSTQLVRNSVAAISGWSGDETLFVDTGVDYDEVAALDVSPAQFITSLARAGDNTNQRFVAGVDMDSDLIYFHPAGTRGVEWQADVGEFDAPRSLANMLNEFYGVYQREDGRIARTARATDDDSIAQYGITRTGKVDVTTSSNSKAELERDLQLNERANPAAAGSFELKTLYGIGGAPVPYWYLRPGDTVAIRNLDEVQIDPAQATNTLTVRRVRFELVSGQASFDTEQAPETVLTVLTKQSKIDDNVITDVKIDPAADYARLTTRPVREEKV